MSGKVKIGVIQLCSTVNKSENFNVCKAFIEKATQDGAKMVFLPENFDFIVENKEQMEGLTETINGELIKEYRNIAKKYDIFLSLGGFHRKCEDKGNNKMYNSHVIIDNNGEIKAVYDKLHLFDVTLPNGVTLKESDAVIPGRSVVNPVETPIGLVALSICYDMRFPELARSMREMSASVLTFPSAFTVPTGKAHWHVLLRARAIENQCFVVAAAQEGQHNSKRTSYGHSVVIDPWGTIMAERDEPGPGLLLCEIDTGLVADVRSRMPIIESRRLDLFPTSSMQTARLDIGSHDFQFGPHVIDASCVFYRSILAFAFVNISPLVPGHVLVSPIRVVPRFSELTSMEVMDIYSVVNLIGPKLAAYFNAHSLTISQQDGPDAGQTVPHVHIHVLPRKPGDFPENDDIYKALQAHDKVENRERKFRTLAVMSAEASDFRKLFY